MSTEEANGSRAKRAEFLLRLMETSVVQRRGHRQILDVLGPTDGATCVLVTGQSDGVGLRLCEGGGTWHSLHRETEGRELFGVRYGSAAQLLDSPKLPLGDRFADAIVVYGYLEYEAEALPFIEDCNRVLKDGGRLVVHVPCAKKWSLARGLRKVLGARGPAGDRPVRPYTAGQLFNTVKDGFDVSEERTYSRFFLEVAETAVDLVANLCVRGMRRRAREVGMPEANDAVAERLYKVRKACYPLLLAATLLDGLLFFTSGHYMVCASRQRMWRPRRTPVLKDGRSIADATINTRIGTASPF